MVVDVRHNNGGFVNVYAIDVLARRGYLTMTPRGLPASPANRRVSALRFLDLTGRVHAPTLDPGSESQETRS